jgi:hypothetical protein
MVGEGAGRSLICINAPLRATTIMLHRRSFAHADSEYRNRARVIVAVGRATAADFDTDQLTKEITGFSSKSKTHDRRVVMRMLPIAVAVAFLLTAPTLAMSQSAKMTGQEQNVVGPAMHRAQSAKMHRVTDTGGINRRRSVLQGRAER